MSVNTISISLSIVDQISSLLKQIIGESEDKVDTFVKDVSNKAERIRNTISDSINASAILPSMSFPDFSPFLNDLGKVTENVQEVIKNTKDLRTVAAFGAGAAGLVIGGPVGLGLGIASLFLGLPEVSDSINNLINDVNNLFAELAQGKEFTKEDYLFADIKSGAEIAEKHLKQFSDRMEPTVENLKFWREKLKEFDEGMASAGDSDMRFQAYLKLFSKANDIVADMESHFRNMPFAGEEVVTITANATDALDEQAKAEENLRKQQELRAKVLTGAYGPWQAAMARAGDSLQNIKSFGDQWYDTAVKLAAEIAANGGQHQLFSDRLIELSKRAKDLNLDLDDQGKALVNLGEFYQNEAVLQKYFAESMGDISYAVEDAPKNIDQNYLPT